MAPETDTRPAGAAAAWLVLALLGAGGWLACAALLDRAQAWRALLVNFCFFTPLAAGLVAWPAVVMLSRGRWLGPVQTDALAGLAVAPVSLLALLALWAGRAAGAGGPPAAPALHPVWLAPACVFTRDGAALALWWLVAARFARRARTGRPLALAGWVGLLYGAVFSLLAFDLVMTLAPRWSSSLFGGYFFVSGLYAALALLTLLAARRAPADRDRLHDLGKLLLAFSLGTAYLMFSQLLPIWYENLPEETRFAVPRMNFAPWAGVSVALLAAVYLGPLVLLLGARAKRTPWYLGAVCLLVLAGLWVERWWLVAPTLGQGLRLGPADLAGGAAFAGAMGWGVQRSRRAAPAPAPAGQAGAHA